MKSTGEVLGLGRTLAEAIARGVLAYLEGQGT